MIGPRIVARSARPRMRRSVIGTNVALAAARRRAVLADRLARLPAVQTPTVLLAGSAGIWLFYVQHQFEDAYWESGATTGATPMRRCAAAPT